MGVFAKRGGGGDEQEPDGSSPYVDLGLRACPACRRELMAWEERCPEDGTPGVARSELQRTDVPDVPPHLLDEPDDGPM
jgi:hypothetical protein